MKHSKRIGWCALLLTVMACGTLQISVEGQPTPDLAASGTVGALLTQNAQLATEVAQLNSATGVPTSIPPTLTPGSAAPATAAAAQRITFLEGATVGVVSAPIEAGRSRDYVLQAFQGQPMFVYVSSYNSDVTFSLRAQDGTTIVPATSQRMSWQGSLPRSGDYFLTIHGGVTTQNFSLTVTVPSRIQFAQGTDSAVVHGSTVAGYGVSYVVYAAKGQKMSVDLWNLSGAASLSIYGFTDGQHYLRSDADQTSYQFALPATQDYIIVVVPKEGRVVGYNLTVGIQ